MSTPELRRQDRMLADADAREVIASAYCGRVATVSADGWPYVVPLLHVLDGDVITMHNTAARGHFRMNVERYARACFEVDEPVKVFDYGRFECDSGLAYRSAIAYGRIRIVDDEAAKIRFFDALLAKYGTGVPGRPKSFSPRWSLQTATLGCAECNQRKGPQRARGESQHWSRYARGQKKCMAPERRHMRTARCRSVAYFVTCTLPSAR